jgi:hypothetical protein
LQFKATETFWRNFYDLSPAQKQSVRDKWIIFQNDPFDPRLGTHRINSLSARMKKTVWSVVIGYDLRVVFVMDDDIVTTLDIGTHAIYK